MKGRLFVPACLWMQWMVGVFELLVPTPEALNASLHCAVRQTFGTMDYLQILENIVRRSPEFLPCEDVESALFPFWDHGF